MNIATVKENLEAVPGLSVSERGAGKAKFLYAQSPNRAVEVAEAENGIWIEYWDNTDKEDEQWVGEEIVTVGEDVLPKIKQWLCVLSGAA